MSGNIPLRDEALERAASEGRLTAADLSGGFALLEDRGDLIRCRIAVRSELLKAGPDDSMSEPGSGGNTPGFEFDGLRDVIKGYSKPVVCEIAYDENHIEPLFLLKKLREGGAVLLKRRLRLRISPKTARFEYETPSGTEFSDLIVDVLAEKVRENGLNAVLLDASDAEEARELIVSNFDPIAGCIPSEAECRLAAEAGQLIGVKYGEKLAGVHHIKRSAGMSETVHIAVDTAYRRQGAGAALMLAAFEKEGVKTHRLWVNSDNMGALDFYSSMGFDRDGWYSMVLQLNG